MTTPAPAAPPGEPFSEALSEAAQAAAMSVRLILTIADAVRRAAQKHHQGEEKELGADAEELAGGWSAEQLRTVLPESALHGLMAGADWPLMARHLTSLQQAGVDLGVFLPNLGRMASAVEQAVARNTTRTRAEGTDRWADLLRRTMPEGLVRNAILASPAWPDLAAEMGRLHEQGVDVARILTDAHAAGLGVDQAVAAATARTSPPSPSPRPLADCPNSGARGRRKVRARRTVRARAGSGSGARSVGRPARAAGEYGREAGLGPVDRGPDDPPRPRSRRPCPRPGPARYQHRRSPPPGEQGQRGPARAGRRAPGEFPPVAAARAPDAHHGPGGRALRRTPRPPRPRHRRLAHRPARRHGHAPAPRCPLRAHHAAGRGAAHCALITPLDAALPTGPRVSASAARSRSTTTGPDAAAHQQPAPAEPAAPAHHRQTAPAPRPGRGR
ncbi:hypothetical protein [Streptomyces rubiginosohelvolus]|uniref:hypothetical protein n=1 Tax=Streptomyces rubiginosohelvolus TaxID=67362 RepID=UPI0033AE3777